VNCRHGLTNRANFAGLDRRLRTKVTFAESRANLVRSAANTLIKNGGTGGAIDVKVSVVHAYLRQFRRLSGGREPGDECSGDKDSAERIRCIGFHVILLD
jgi:hypothetical protein